MFQKYFLSIIIFVNTFLLAFVSLSAQEEGKIIIISDWIGKVIHAKENLYQNLSISQTVSSDSGEITDHQDVVYKEPGTAFFVELIGKPLSSINIDFRINKSSRFSLGIVSYSESKNEDGKDKYVNSFMPNIMYYYLGGKKNKRFEIGGGFSVRPIWHKEINGDFPLAFHGVIGYRYQKKNGLLFRIGFTPSIYPEVFLPFIGISFGYSF